MSEAKSFFMLFVCRDRLRVMHDQGHICILLKLGIPGCREAKHKQISKHTDNCTDDGKKRIEWTWRMTLLCASFTLSYSLAFVVRRRVCRCVFVLLAYSDYSPENQNRMPADPDKEV